MRNRNQLVEKIFWIVVIIVFVGLTTYNFWRTKEGKDFFGILKFSNEQQATDNTSAGSLFGIYEQQPNISYIKYVKPVKAKGLYLSEWTFSSKVKRDYWVDIVNTTELNSIVLNVKNDDGKVAFDMDLPLVNEISSDKGAPIKNIKEVIINLKENGIYPIARIVVFKDPYLAEKRPDLSIKDKAGKVLRMKTSSGRTEAWVNPYNEEVWDYNIAIAKAAAEVGFEEIQFDYIRFSSGSEMKLADLGEIANVKTKQDIIVEFTEKAYKELKPYGVYVSADVFATVIHSDLDSRIIGQDYVRMAKTLDYICPMTYPSHYANGTLGVKYPDLQPYDIIVAELKKSKEALDKIPEGEHRAIVRPWLQDFTASWVKPYQKYTAQQIREQKNAVYDSNLNEWLLWDANNKYSIDGLEKSYE